MMNQGNFIQQQYVQPQAPSRVPREGIGLLSVLAFLVALLAAVVTAGMIFLDNNYKNRVETTLEDLRAIQRQIELDSFHKVLDTQNRIEIASAMISTHVYPSQVFNFVEDNTIEAIAIEAFGYESKVLTLTLRAPSYLEFAQQVKHYRSLPSVEEISFEPPTLTTTGQVKYIAKIMLTDQFIREPAQL